MADRPEGVALSENPTCTCGHTLAIHFTNSPFLCAHGQRCECTGFERETESRILEDLVGKLTPLYDSVPRDIWEKALKRLTP
jgi:hypothetical protein